MNVLFTSESNGIKVINYTKDGKTVSHMVKVPIQTEPIESVEPQSKLEEVAETTLLETQYQTLLIEMLAGF